MQDSDPFTNNVLVSTRQAPYGDSLANDALTVALTYAAFGKSVSLLFLDDGVLQLLDEQTPGCLIHKNTAKMLQSLALYDIDKIFADELAMQERGVNLAHCVIPVRPLAAAAISALMAQHQTLLSF